MTEFAQAWYCKWGRKADIDRAVALGSPVMTADHLNRNLAAAYDLGVESDEALRRGAVAFGNRLKEVTENYRGGDATPTHIINDLLKEFNI